MANLNNNITSILSSAVFQKIANNDMIKIGQLNAAIGLLITSGIGFDLEFSPGTNRLAAAALLIIYINPTTTISFTINFEAGGSTFGGGT